MYIKTYAGMYSHTHKLELPCSDALAWRSQGQGGCNVCKCEWDTHTHTVFVPMRRRSCHVSLWQMTPVGKKSARRFCFRFSRAASLLLFLLLSNRVAFNGTAARSAACGISFIEIRGELMWLTKRRIRRKARIPLIRKHIQSEVSVCFAKTKKSSKCAHKKQTWLFFQVEWTALHFCYVFSAISNQMKSKNFACFVFALCDNVKCEPSLMTSPCCQKYCLTALDTRNGTAAATTTSITHLMFVFFSTFGLLNLFCDFWEVYAGNVSWWC